MSQQRSKSSERGRTRHETRGGDGVPRIARPIPGALPLALEWLLLRSGFASIETVPGLESHHIRGLALARQDEVYCRELP
jgi:hypothetical protein